MDAGRPRPSPGKADAVGGDHPLHAADPADGDRPRLAPGKADVAGGGHPLHDFLWEDPVDGDRRFRGADPVAAGRPGRGSETADAGHPLLAPDRADAAGGDPEPLPSAGAADGGHRLHAAAPPKNAGPPGHGDPDRPGRPAAARGRGSPRRRSVPGCRRPPGAGLGGDPRGVSGRVRPGPLHSVVLSCRCSFHEDMNPGRQLRQAPLDFCPQFLDSEPA